MPQPLSRRRFLRSSAASAVAMAAGAAVASPAQAAQPASGPSTRPFIPWRGAAKTHLNIGIIGVGGRGWDHVRDVSKIENACIVALCDVDKNNLANACHHVPSATTYEDFRDLLEHPRLDAVLIATPDHTHAVAAAAAMRAGLHVYCEKPLTHTIHEARTLVQLAKQYNRVTQTGMQIHTLGNYARVAEVIQSGAIGPVRDVQIWIDRPWPTFDPALFASPPAHLNYNLWLGPLPMRPFRPSYHPMWWRRWRAFSNGVLGDIACHYMDVAFWALDLHHPTRIETESAPTHEDVCPDWRIVHYDFLARSDKPALKLTWYDGGKRPPGFDAFAKENRMLEGVLFIGDNGSLLAGYTEYHLLPAEKFKDFKPPEKRIPDSPGIQREWIDACLSGDPKAVGCPFEYGALITEAAILANIAIRAGKPIEWDAANMRIPNAPEAERFLKSDYRPGWSL
jgi:predicted dehydrogenase